MSRNLEAHRLMATGGGVLDSEAGGRSSVVATRVLDGTTTPPEDRRMDARLVKEMPLPPEVSAQIERMRSVAALTTAQERRFLDDVRLQYLYPGRAVVCYETPEGLAVVGVAEAGAGHAREIKDRLPEPFRTKARIVFPEGW